VTERMKNRELGIEFSCEVRRRRTALGISLRNFENLCGLTPSFICSIENGERDPCLSSIVALAKGLGISPAELFWSANGLSPAAGEMARLWSEVPREVQAALMEVLIWLTQKDPS
jgi:transcriptional regulator with XRE-family HTH domain